MTGLPVPAIPVFPAGYGPLPSDFDTWVQDSLGFCTTGIVFRAEMHGSQSLPGGSNTPVQYDTIAEDPYSGWNASTFRWTAPWTGWYEVTVTATITAQTNVMAALVGTPQSLLKGSLIGVQAILFGGVTASQMVPLVGGSDYVYGSTFVQTTATTNTVNGRYSTIEIGWAGQ